MGKVVGKPAKLLTLEEAKAAIAFDQPKLRASANGEKIHIEGSYLVFEKDVVSAPGGPIAEFDIRIELRFQTRANAETDTFMIYTRPLLTTWHLAIAPIGGWKVASTPRRCLKGSGNGASGGSGTKTTTWRT